MHNLENAGIIWSPGNELIFHSNQLEKNFNLKAIHNIMFLLHTDSSFSAIKLFMNNFIPAKYIFEVLITFFQDENSVMMFTSVLDNNGQSNSTN